MILYIDTETTGLPDFKKPADHPSQPHVCALGMVKWDQETAEDAAYSVTELFVTPGDDWTMEPKAQEAHGLTLEYLAANGHEIEEVLDLFEAWLAEADLLVAYNKNFDLKLMRGALRRSGRADDFQGVKTWCPIHVCTKLCKIPPTPKMVASGRNHYKTASLTEAFEFLTGETMMNAHSAAADAMALAKIHAKLIEMQEAQAYGA